MSEKAKGKIRSEETRKRISDAKKNPSEKTKKKLSEAKKGTILSAEHKEKISQSLKGRIPWNKGKTMK